MGMHGWKHVNRAIQSADLLFAIGMRFDDRVTGNVRTYAPYARIVHVDIDPAEIGKNVAVEVPIVGDAKRVLAALLPMVEAVDPATRADYFAELAEWRRESEGSSWHGSGAWRDGLLSADYVIERIGELTDHAATYVADVGQNQMWLARYAGFRKPNTHVSSGGLGTMGFSVPAAMGAALGAPDRETWAITGDGGFQMTFQELMTLIADRIPVKIALLDNKKLGMIRQWQEIIYAGNYHSAHLPGPDFAKLADAFGIPAFRAQHPGRGRRRDPGRPGGRRPGPRLVRDRRGAERLPDDAGRQGPVRPDREVGRGGRVSGDAELERARAGRATPPAHAAPPARALPGGGETRRHTLIAIVLDKPGVLNRVSSLMRARNFNIDSLAVSRTDQPDMSRMTITLHGDDVAVEQAAKQLYRLIDVLKVQEVTAEPVVAQELALVKIRATDANRAEILKLVELSKGRVVDLAGESVIVEVTGPETRGRRVRRASSATYGIKELSGRARRHELRGFRHRSRRPVESR